MSEPTPNPDAWPRELLAEASGTLKANIAFFDETERVVKALLDRIEALEAAQFQSRVQPWMMACFGAEISADMLERADRFTEEALELAQTMPGFTAERAHALVDYVFGRLIGEREQEVGGVMVTLAALCLAAGMDMHAAGESELSRINRPEIIEKIRAKQATKPTGSALPIASDGGENA